MPHPRNQPPPPLDYARPTPPKVPRYRKILSGLLLSAGLVLCVYGLFMTNPAARENVWTAALALSVWGLVIRFQHVRF